MFRRRQRHGPRRRRSQQQLSRAQGRRNTSALPYRSTSLGLPPRRSRDVAVCIYTSAGRTCSHSDPSHHSRHHSRYLAAPPLSRTPVLYLSAARLRLQGPTRASWDVRRANEDGAKCSMSLFCAPGMTHRPALLDWQNLEVQCVRCRAEQELCTSQRSSDAQEQ